MTDQELKEIENRCNATTKGHWNSYIEGRDHDSGSSFIMTGISEGEDSNRGEDIYLTGATNADQDFIAHARQDIPRLLAEVRKLREELNNK